MGKVKKAHCLNPTCDNITDIILDESGQQSRDINVNSYIFYCWRCDTRFVYKEEFIKTSFVVGKGKDFSILDYEEW